MDQNRQFCGQDPKRNYRQSFWKGLMLSEFPYFIVQAFRDNVDHLLECVDKMKSKNSGMTTFNPALTN